MFIKVAILTPWSCWTMGTLVPEQHEIVTLVSAYSNECAKQITY
jgi:hypothetical protein